MKQSETFLDAEGDQWFLRNRLNDFDLDPVLSTISTLFPEFNGSLLEIGCSDGRRLLRLQNTFDVSVYGIEPSAKAVAAAQEQGLNVQQGVASILPYENQKFDVVLFGFCLYLCDREDLFMIASEADRVLRNNGKLFIYDFDPGLPCSNKYKHLPQVTSYKMDYSTLFLWNPIYTLEHKLSYSHSKELGHCIDENERVSVCILQKQVINNFSGK